MYYEIVYETGDRSVAYYDSEDEMKQAIESHHERAKAGEPALPRSQSFDRADLAPEDKRPIGEIPAVRVKKVFKYDKHPVDLFEQQGLATDTVKSEVNAFLKGSEVTHAPELAAKIRNLTNPLVEDAGRQESQYKAPGTEVTLDWLGKD